MEITKEEVRNIAKLAKLKLREEEAEKMAREFEAILGYFKSIDQIALDGVEQKTINHRLGTVLRKDESKLFTDKNKLFQNVKGMRDSYIEVPRIIE